jgi:UDP-2,3-diacylglucosamine hydrolase
MATMHADIPDGKKVYFFSDIHLGAPDVVASRQRELMVIQFLNEIRADAFAIFLVGDLFDFWFEYQKVVPKGFVRVLGKLAELTDNGIQIHFFVGNHDMWMKTYLQEELNIPVYFEPQEFSFNKTSFLIGHGDGLGPGDRGYKRLKKLFRSPLSQRLFGLVPPYLGIGLANYSSRRSREASGGVEEEFLGEEKEWLIIYSKEKLKEKVFSYFVFGHRHLPIDYRLSPESRYINLGDWINYQTYAVFDGGGLTLKSYTNKEHKIIRKN